MEEKDERIVEGVMRLAYGASNIAAVRITVGAFQSLVHRGILVCVRRTVSGGTDGRIRSDHRGPRNHITPDEIMSVAGLHSFAGLEVLQGETCVPARAAHELVGEQSSSATGTSSRVCGPVPVM